MNDLHSQLNQCAEAMGGKNFFLTMLEAIREAKFNLLSDKNCLFPCETGQIKWNKVIFLDKVELLLKIYTENSDGNLLPDEKEKGHKSVTNMLRALKPIEFTVKPKNRKDGEGFSFKMIEIADDGTTRIDPIFEVLFLKKMGQAKSLLNDKPEPS